MTDQRIEDDHIKILDNETEGRYELWLSGERIGLADYFRRGDVVVIPHTETTPAFGGRGFASRLIQFALEDIAARGLRVDPVCPFVASYIDRHAEFAGLVRV